MKTCTKCGGPGPFYVNNSSKDGLTARCKACRDAYGKTWRKTEQGRQVISTRRKSDRIETSRYRSRYDCKEGHFPIHGYVPPEPVDGLCECCRRAPNFSGLCIDHEHSLPTDNFRAWLCHRCNTGTGMIGDTWEAIERFYKFWHERFHRPQPIQQEAA